jgi:hypothetical protein
MESSNTPRRLLRLIGRLAACAASLSLTSPSPVFADLLDQRNELVNKFVNDMHADPLVADCAAHGNFVASTSTAIDHVEFPPNSFDSAHATITPWNDAFDEGKQRVKVDNIVTVEGLGVRHDSNGAPANLKFRCGYVGPRMLAFSWNDPVPPAKPRGASSSSKKKKGKHTGNSTVKKSAGGSSGQAASSKSTTTKAAAKKPSAQQSS